MHGRDIPSYNAGMENHLDHPCCRNTGRPVIGIDEVGRGSLIGDVVTSAVCFLGPLPTGLADSKKISAKKRIVLDEAIRSCAHWSIGRASIEEIDSIGILAATLLAMKRAWMGLDADLRRDALVIIDGDKEPDIRADMEIMPRADQLCPTVSAASIVAKVHRDNAVIGLHNADGRYAWDRNKGYGTRDHFLAIEEHGPSPYHRRSFQPVRGMLRRK